MATPIAEPICKAVLLRPEASPDSCPAATSRTSSSGCSCAASGLSNTALQIGSALGVAIVSTVAVSRSAVYLAAHKGASPLVVLTEGYQSAFVACAVLAGIVLALALLLPGRPRKAAHERPGCHAGQADLDEAQANRVE